jgi:hypothetical protein
MMNREYESRKQINSCPLSSPETHPPAVQPALSSPPSNPPGHVAPSKLKYPVQEFSPRPMKRTKFRNMLTKDGGLVGDEEVAKILAVNGHKRNLKFEELLGSGTCVAERKGDGCVRQMEKEQGVGDLLDLEMTCKSPTPGSARITKALECTSPTLTTPSIATTPSTPSLDSNSTNPTTLSAPGDRSQSPSNEGLLISPQALPTAEHKGHSPLLLLEEEESLVSRGGAFEDLASLSQSFESCTMNDLSGLHFGGITRSEVSSSTDIYYQLRDLVHVNESQTPQTLQTEPQDFTFPIISLDFKSPQKGTCDSPQVKNKEEAIVFQGRRSRKSTPEITKSTPEINPAKGIDADNADRAFRMFSAEIMK